MRILHGSVSNLSHTAADLHIEDDVEKRVRREGCNIKRKNEYCMSDVQL